MTREELRKRLDEYQYPDTKGLMGKNNKLSPALKNQYRRFVEKDLRIGTQEAYDMLCTEAYRRLNAEEEKIKAAARKEIQSGKIRIEDGPLKREIEPDGRIILSNIPPEYMDILAFTFYLEGIWDWKYGIGKHSAQETILCTQEHIHETLRMEPGIKSIVAISADDFFHLILDQNDTADISMIRNLVIDFLNKGNANENKRIRDAMLYSLFNEIEKDVSAISENDYTVIDGEAYAREHLKRISGEGREYTAREMSRMTNGNKAAAVISNAINSLILKRVITESELSARNPGVVFTELLPDGENSVIRYDIPKKSGRQQILRRIIAVTMHYLAGDREGNERESFIRVTAAALADDINKMMEEQ